MNAKTARKQLKQFFDGGKRLTFARKEVIIQAGSPAADAFWVNKGYVKVVSYSKTGSERNHFFFGPNELFSLTTLFDRHIEELAFIAASDVELTSRTSDEFKDFTDKNPMCLYFVVDLLINVIDRLYALQLETAQAKVVYFLLNLASRFGSKDGTQTTIDLPLSQQEFAEAVRLTRESVGKILGKLEEGKYIIVGRKYIMVYTDKLRKHLEDLE